MMRTPLSKPSPPSSSRRLLGNVVGDKSPDVGGEEERGRDESQRDAALRAPTTIPSPIAAATVAAVAAAAAASPVTAAGTSSEATSCANIESPFAWRLALNALLDAGRGARAEEQVLVSTAALARVLGAATTRAAALDADLSLLCRSVSERTRPLVAPGNRGGVQDGGEGGADSWASVLEALPDSILGAVYAFLSSTDTLGRVALVSRRMQRRVYTPGGVVHLCVGDASAALRHVPTGRWSALQTLCCKVRAPSKRSEKKARDDWQALVDASGHLGPRLRTLHCRESEAPWLAPSAAVWPGLRELCVVTTGELTPGEFAPAPGANDLPGKGTWSYSGAAGADRDAPPPPPRSLPALERLTVMLNNEAPHGRCLALTNQAVPGRLRDLALQLRVWDAAAAAAVTAHAPHLESLHLNFCPRRGQTCVLPALPRATTLSVGSSWPMQVQLAAEAHPRLGCLLLDGRAALEIASPHDAEDEDACGVRQEGKWKTDAGWRAGALHTLRTCVPTPPATRAVLSAPGGHGPLDVLCLTECSRGFCNLAQAQAALAFAEALGRGSARKLSLRLGAFMHRTTRRETVRPSSSSRPEGEVRALLGRLLSWPCLEEVWIDSNEVPHSWWEDWEVAQSLRAVHLGDATSEQLRTRPPTLPARVKWYRWTVEGAMHSQLLPAPRVASVPHSEADEEAEELDRRQCQGGWPPRCMGNFHTLHD